MRSPQGSVDMEVLAHDRGLNHLPSGGGVAPLPLLVARGEDLFIGHVGIENVAPFRTEVGVSLLAAAPHTADLYVHGPVAVGGGQGLETSEG